MLKILSCKAVRRLRGTNTVAGLLALAVFGGGLSARGGTPDWLKAAAHAQLPGSPEDTAAFIVLDERITSVTSDGDVKTVYRRAYKILTSGGRDVGKVTVYFDQDTQLTYLKGWSISATGAEYELKEKDAVESSVSPDSMYQGIRYKTLNLSAETGGVVGWEYQQHDRPMIQQDMWSFQHAIPVLRTHFVLELPNNWNYTAVWRNHEPVEPRAVGSNRWSWELQNVPALVEEEDMPAWLAVAGWLGVTYRPPGQDVAAGNQMSWLYVGRWYEGLAATRRNTTPEIQGKVAALTGSQSSTLEKLRLLAYFVQHEIRYVAIEIGIGGYQPHTAGEIFDKRYGDCKDKVTLLSTMLREIGIDSYYVLVNSQRGVVTQEFPSPLVFDHVILAIRLPGNSEDAGFYSLRNDQTLGRLLFFDPTDSNTPLGQLPASLQAGNGLLVTEKGAELVGLPLLPPATNRLERTATLVLSSTGALSGNVKETRFGSWATELRAQLMAAPVADRAKALQDFVANLLGNARFVHATIDNMSAYDRELVLNYQFVSEHYAQSAGDLLLFRPHVLGSVGVTVLEQKPRKLPLEFSDAYMRTEVFSIELPADYKVDELPLSVQQAYPFGEYRSATEVSGKVLRYSRSLQMKDVYIRTDQLEDCRKFYRQIADDERATAVLKRIKPPV